jgi:hypothetical protein
MKTFPSIERQRGAAGLVVTVLLVLAMLLVVAFANRNVVVEVRASTNQYRSTQAFEAAEAGLEWALAKLNDDTPIGADCLPSANAGAMSFRDRHLRLDSASAGLVVATWDDAGTPRPLQAACVRGDAGWSCSCPSSGAPVLPVVAGTATAPSFSVELATGARPNLVKAVASGCTRADVPCTAISDAAHEAAARVEVSFGLVPGLRAAPTAALTVRGNVDAGAAALGVHNPDPASGGTAVQAGGGVTGDALRLGTPAVTRIACTDACADAVASAVAGGNRLLAVEGDLVIDGPLALGTAEQPIALVVGGALRLRGAIALHGVVVAASIDWRDAAAGAFVRGAVLVEGDYGGDAAADIVHDSSLLAQLQHGSGSFARVNGSWKDF